MSQKIKPVNNFLSNSSKIVTRRWSSIAMTGFFIFALIIISMHLIQPEFAPKERFMSEYALGQYGWLLNIGILGNLIGCIALIKAIYHSYSPPVRSWTSIIFLGVATISILTNFFLTDQYGKIITISGYIHSTGSFIGSIASLLFMFIHSVRLKLYGLLRGFYNILILLSILSSIFFIIMLIVFERISGYVGIVQRIYASMVLLWLIINSNGIRSGAIIPTGKTEV